MGLHFIWIKYLFPLPLLCALRAIVSDSQRMPKCIFVLMGFVLMGFCSSGSVGLHPSLSQESLAEISEEEKMAYFGHVMLKDGECLEKEIIQ